MTIFGEDLRRATLELNKNLERIADALEAQALLEFSRGSRDEWVAMSKDCRLEIATKLTFFVMRVSAAREDNPQKEAK